MNLNELHFITTIFCNWMLPDMDMTEPKPGRPDSQAPDATDFIYTKCPNGMRNQPH